MAEPLALSDARARVLAQIQPDPATESVALLDAHGRSLAGEVCADGPWPATDRSAMDGFAVAAGPNGVRDQEQYDVIGESLAGRPFEAVLGEGKAIRIMTGAVVPEGATTVVPVELTSGYAGEVVTITAAVAGDSNIRRRGSEREAGTTVLAAGRRLRAAEIGVLAVLGHGEVAVRRRPKVAIVATGDEVVPLEEMPAPYQVRESNSWALAAQVVECGGVATRLGIAPDERDGLRAMLPKALADADVVLTIGGISKGTHDLVQETLEELGVRTNFHGIQLKPGKPTYFGIREEGAGRQYVFGLPGNPASTFVVFDLLVRPALTRWLGGDPGEWGLSVPLGDTDWKPNRRLQAVGARLVPGPDGGLVAELAKPSPSGDPFSLLFGSCYALIPSGATRAGCAGVELSGSSGGIELP